MTKLSVIEAKENMQRTRRRHNDAQRNLECKSDALDIAIIAWERAKHRAREKRLQALGVQPSTLYD